MKEKVWGVKVMEPFEDGDVECLRTTFYLRYRDARDAAVEVGGRVVLLTEEELDMAGRFDAPPYEYEGR